MWKKRLKQMSDDKSLLLVEEYCLIRSSSIVILEKSNSRKLYSVLIPAKDHQPTSQKYFNKIFPNMKVPWQKIHCVTRKVTVTVTYAAFTKKSSIMFFILIRSFFQFGKTVLLCVHFVKLNQKHHSMFFVTVLLPKILEST